MSTVSEYLENLIEECGGYGKYQLLLSIILLGSKMSVAWTMLMMSFAGAKPDWWCVSESNHGNETWTSEVCTPANTSYCLSYKYDDSMNTIINEWDLVCDRSWISALITTIQMAGVLVGGLLCGQMGDYFGRKPTFFISLSLITVSNFLAIFPTSWQMFAVLRFFMGISCGMLLTVYLVLVNEFIKAEKRAVMSGVPVWALYAALFALSAWRLHDWRYLHIATAATSAPFLLTWWFLPESFRWLVAHQRFDEARTIIKNIARINGVPEPDISGLRNLIIDTRSTYTLLDIFKGKRLFKNTIYHAVMWIAVGYVFYAVSFGVQGLSGNLYLNMFLVSTIVIPGNTATIWIMNKYGRKWTSFWTFMISALGSLGVAIIQNLSTTVMEGKLVTGLALVTKLGCGAGWVSLAVMSTEIYPTVVRNLGYGFLNTAARVGGMLAPQMVFISATIPGFLYFASCVLMLASAVCAALSTETGGKQLADTIHVTPLTMSSKPLISITDSQEKHQINNTDAPI